MVEEFDIEQRWPELFVPLDARQRQAVRQALAAGWHEGWSPSRSDVERLVAEATGAIDVAEYLRQVRAAAMAAAAPASFSGSTPIEICEQYAAGAIDRARLVDELSRFPYAPGDETDGYDSLIVDPPGTWGEVEQALRRGLIEEDVYEEVFGRRAGPR